jgi:hypothetical protein
LHRDNVQGRTNVAGAGAQERLAYFARGQESEAMRESDDVHGCTNFAGAGAMTLFCVCMEVLE